MACFLTRIPIIISWFYNILLRDSFTHGAVLFSFPESFGSIFSVSKSSTCCLRSRSADSFLWAKETGLRVKRQGLKPFRVRLKKSPHFHFVPSRIFSGSLDIYPPATLNSPRNEIGTLRALDAKKMSALWNKKD